MWKDPLLTDAAAALAADLATALAAALSVRSARLAILTYPFDLMIDL